MAHEYRPNHGYGLLRFGMSPGEATAILGEPTAFRSPFENIPLPDDLADACGGVRCMEFAATRTDHRYPQLMFDRDRLTVIALFAAGGPFVFGGHDLFARDRRATLRRLAAGEETCFTNGESVLFPVQGLDVPSVKHAQKLPSLSLVDAIYALERLETNCYEICTAFG